MSHQSDWALGVRACPSDAELLLQHGAWRRSPSEMTVRLMRPVPAAPTRQRTHDRRLERDAGRDVDDEAERGQPAATWANASSAGSEAPSSMDVAQEPRSIAQHLARTCR